MISLIFWRFLSKFSPKDFYAFIMIFIKVVWMIFMNILTIYYQNLTILVFVIENSIMHIFLINLFSYVQKQLSKEDAINN